MACFICFCGFVTRWAAASELIGPQDVITIDDWGIDVDSDLDSSSVDAVTVMPDFTVDIPSIVPASAWDDGNDAWDVSYETSSSGGLELGSSSSDAQIYGNGSFYGLESVGSNAYILASRTYSSTSPSFAYVWFNGGVSNFEVKFSQDVQYFASDYEVLNISGTLFFDALLGASKSTSAGGTMSFYTVSDTSDTYNVTLLVNGNDYGQTISIDAGGGAVSWSVDLSETGNITSLGYKFGMNDNPTRRVAFAGLKRVSAAVRFNDSSITIDASESTSSLLGGILEFLQNILNGILSLPANIASAIGNILQSLFVPSQDFLTMIRQEFEVLLSDRLGFLYQAGTMITDFATGIYDQLNSSYDMEFEFPGIGFESDLVDSGYIEILEPTTVSLDDNDFVTTIQPYLGTAVAFICVLAFVNAAHDMVVAVIGGRSYFDYLFRRGEGDA